MGRKVSSERGEGCASSPSFSGCQTHPAAQPVSCEENPTTSSYSSPPPKKRFLRQESISGREKRIKHPKGNDATTGFGTEQPLSHTEMIRFALLRRAEQHWGAQL